MGCVILAWLGPVEPRCCHWLSLLSVTVVDIFWVFSDLLLLVPFASPAFDLAFPRKYSPWVWNLISRFFFTAPLCVGSERGVCLQWVLPFLGHILPRELSHHWASYLGTYPLLAFSLHVSVYTRSYWLVDWLYVCACCWGSAQGLVLVRPGLCHIVISPAPHMYLQFHFVFCKWHGCAQHAIWEDECKVVQIYFVNLLGMLRNEGLGRCILSLKMKQLAENRACSVHAVSVAFIFPFSCEIAV